MKIIFQPTDNFLFPTSCFSLCLPLYFLVLDKMPGFAISLPHFCLRFVS
nr:MAG TPA: hypothetical protein [Caudoviricetes sp.]